MELWLASLIGATGIALFRQFEEKTPLWKRLSKWAVYFGLATLLSRTLGRPWFLVWMFGLPAFGTAFHVRWCRKHGINILTAEPRDKYFKLRGWA